ncbi:NHLP leader peptide family RiPP precursor [Aetokthonos hydrillicola Thurmond2011]|jgi:hypothetical protein|uniref:NHLP leader peptide family RiPP n=1 Tax=Aetokthonos hydrillicola Thurmond2011 TaxID=2712845 RepID=A0AAP5I8P0_9CYAN|nr:NHLP leader peptide family RiPP precursor [Aetokthonos hydrillicola]MBO3458688.1 NHLP leader peptide family natural product precursor [Aetokthonos hydrillicola CCALA 1050]MBW4588041.1 NHLP leader peptide family RiPP precursor [Aetokthonos hydrillicola CCALA 1050]MDR9897007.1 NHLP leader peptide family RiPP precursor [Aetokthonos hydrillicola Thurmond2011]
MSNQKEMLAEGLNKRFELEKQVILKAWEDEAFRQDLLSNPAAACAKALNQELPEGFSIEVIQETPGTVKLVLPAFPSQVSADTELTSEALEGVSGGSVKTISFINKTVTYLLG